MPDHRTKQRGLHQKSVRVVSAYAAMPGKNIEIVLMVIKPHLMDIYADVSVISRVQRRLHL